MGGISHQIIPFVASSQPRFCPPEYRLIAAVLADAVRCVCRAKVPESLSQSPTAYERKTRKNKIAIEAREWLLDSPIDSDEPFSFAWICLMLNTDARRVRENIRRTIESPTFNIEETRFVEPAAAYIPSALYELN